MNNNFKDRTDTDKLTYPKLNSFLVLYVNVIITH